MRSVVQEVNSTNVTLVEEKTEEESQVTSTTLIKGNTTCQNKP